MAAGSDTSLPPVSGAATALDTLCASPGTFSRFVSLPWPAARRAHLVLKLREGPISAEYAIHVRDASKKKQGDAGSTLVTGGGRLTLLHRDSATWLLLQRHPGLACVSHSRA